MVPFVSIGDVNASSITCNGQSFVRIDNVIVVVVAAVEVVMEIVVVVVMVVVVVVVVVVVIMLPFLSNSMIFYQCHIQL